MTRSIKSGKAMEGESMSSTSTTSPSSSSSAPWTIIIADRGFVLAGKPTRDGEYVYIADCYVARRYSQQTKDGIGGLGYRVPTAGNDDMDPCPTARLPTYSMVCSFEVEDQAGWQKWHEGNLDKRSPSKRGRVRG